MDINDAQLKVDTWIKTVGVRYFNELTNLALLTEEVGGACKDHCPEIWRTEF